MTKLWQHTTPQPVEACQADPVRPTRQTLDTRSRPKVCIDCGRPIREVDENEGPEALKTLFRF